MTLNSVVFLMFFIIVFILYFTLFQRHQAKLLLAASLVFLLSYEPASLILCLVVSAFVWAGALLVESRINVLVEGEPHYLKTEKSRKLLVVLCVLLLLGILFIYKYLNFSIHIFARIFRMDPASDLPVFHLLLPVGISFWIFQNIAYLVDVYKSKIKAEKNLGRYLLFISYFPKLSVGPIERAESLLPQLAVNHKFDYDEAVDGMRMVMIGLFKKIAVADTIAPIVNNVYDNCSAYSGLSLIAATGLYAFQIYGDFSGYTDMAIGFSRILGIRLMENFRCPYLSKSISEFWRRWHISLSSWFRDYVYIPLGGNRVKLVRYLLNTMITFTLSGVWHGASTNFILWGAVNGLFLCIENLKKRLAHNKKEEKKERSILGFFKWAVTFCLICFSWIFFRAKTFSDALYIIRHAFSNLEFSVSYVRQSLVSMGFSKFYFALATLVILILIVVDIKNYKQPVSEKIKVQKTWVRWGIYIVFAVVILVCKIYTAESQEFIYFQF